MKRAREILEKCLEAKWHSKGFINWVGALFTSVHLSSTKYFHINVAEFETSARRSWEGWCPIWSGIRAIENHAISCFWRDFTEVLPVRDSVACFNMDLCVLLQYYWRGCLCKMRIRANLLGWTVREKRLIRDAYARYGKEILWRIYASRT